MFVFLLLTVCFVLSTAERPTTCPKGYKQLDNTCYKLLHVRLSFFEAVTACDVIDGKLVEIVSSEDQKRVGQYLTSIHAASDIWLGATDMQREADWLYMSSHNEEAISTYSNWAPTAPKFDQTKNCAFLSFPNSWRWMDEACTNHYTPLCYVTLSEENNDVIG